MKSDDGSYLTLVHLMGENGERPFLKAENIEKTPVMCFHGLVDSTLGWTSFNRFKPRIPVAFVINGYDV